MFVHHTRSIFIFDEYNLYECPERGYEHLFRYLKSQRS